MFKFLKKILKKKPTLAIVKGDITNLGLECVVNAANQQLIRGGGVCGSIYKAAGPRLEKLTELLEPIPVGEAVITDGFDCSDLIIHAVGPMYDPSIYELQKEELANAYLNSLRLASLYDVKNIGFPLISTGIYCFPKETAILIALKTIQHFIEKEATSLESIYIVCFSQEDYYEVSRAWKWL